MTTVLQPRAAARTWVEAGVHQTPWWTVWSLWTARGLDQIVWQPPAAQQLASLGRDTRRVAELDAALATYFAGGGSDALQRVEVDPAGWTPFFAEVYRACRAIPQGQTLRYGQLAAAVGRPRAVRAVGQAMARNRVPLVIPCHRVVGATGSLGGFSAPGGLQTKRRLLELERSK